MSKNRTMEQKNLTNKKRAMKEARERRFDIMCQEYHYPEYLHMIGVNYMDYKQTSVNRCLQMDQKVQRYSISKQCDRKNEAANKQHFFANRIAI